jgi:glycosyltransferase involved in cell wall biosynthesis
MKIVFYCKEAAPANIDNYLELGVSGTVSAMILASHGLTKIGHNVVVLNNSESGNYQGTRYVKIESPEEVAWHVADFGPIDVFIANGWAGDFFLHNKVSAPTKVHWVHNFIDRVPVERAIADGKLDYIVCISLNQLGTWWRSPAFSRVTNISNSVDTRRIKALMTNARGEKKIMFIGATRESKGFHDGLRVFRKFHSLHPDYRLYVAGGASLHGSAGPLSTNGIFEREYEDRCLKELLYDDEGNLREEIVLLGRISRKEVLEHLSNTRVALVNPSWTSEPETFCVSAVEAQALGVPVVSTFRGGLPEVIDDGKSGILVKDKDDRTMVDAIERITGNERLASNFAAHGMANVAAKFDLSRIASEWDKKLRHMAAGKPFRGNMCKAIRSKIRHKFYY